MDKKLITTEFKVGLTLILSTLILIFGIIWGKEFRLKTNKYHIDVVFDNVGGMVPGDPVTVNGVKEGKIVSIGWSGRDVLCTLEINDHVQLYEDADFIVISAELLAGMKVEIFPGKSENLISMNQQPFRGRYGGRIVDVGMTIGELSEDLSALTFRLDTTVAMVNGLLKDGKLQGDIQQTLSNVNQITADFKDVLSASTGNLRNAVVNFEKGSEKLNSMLEANEGPVSASLNNVSRISARLDSMAFTLHVLLKQVENKEGTLGKMMYDTTLYDNLNRTLIGVDSLARKIEKKGLHISLF